MDGLHTLATFHLQNIHKYADISPPLTLCKFSIEHFIGMNRCLRFIGPPLKTTIGYWDKNQNFCSFNAQNMLTLNVWETD